MARVVMLVGRKANALGKDEKRSKSRKGEQVTNRCAWYKFGDLGKKKPPRGRASC